MSVPPVPSPGLVLQHGDDGPPARLGEWLRERGVPYVVVRTWEEPLPGDPRAFAFVASLGSEHSVTATVPAWIRRELDLLRAAVAARVPILGICWGAQALSTVLGGGIVPCGSLEFGWHELRSGDPEIPVGPWAQHHSDLILLPPGAQPLAHSPAGLAAFRHGPHLGVQFHPEATAAITDAWRRTDAASVRAGGHGSPGTWNPAAAEGPARTAAFALFDAWWRRLASEPDAGATISRRSRDDAGRIHHPHPPV